VAKGRLSESASLRVIETEKPVIMEQQLNKGLPNEKYVIIRATPIFGRNGKIKYIINYLWDITEKNNLMLQLDRVIGEREKYVIELAQLREANLKDREIVTRSKEMHDVMNRALRVAGTDFSVLLTGESGTGKELLARFIHKNSLRSEKTFLSVNCGAFPENLLESELFGYEKGSFSGARSEGKKGIFEYADEGTLFLDEVGDMSSMLQVKLLRVLQEGEVLRVGSTKPKYVDVRIIAATNTDLETQVQKGAFRKDLYYRLNVVPVKVPPLRNRREDIPVLVKHFTDKVNAKYNMRREFSAGAVDAIMQLDFPGNVRELENMTERIALFAESDIVRASDVRANTNASNGSFDATARIGDPAGEGSGHANEHSLYDLLDAYEKKLLLDCLHVCRTTTSMAEQLGVDQSTVSRKLRKHGISVR
jgi:transcriptional regulator with PAS, ATPase and Fis domain